MVRAGARMDFFVYYERAQVFLSVQTAGRNLPIQNDNSFSSTWNETINLRLRTAGVWGIPKCASGRPDAMLAKHDTPQNDS